MTYTGLTRISAMRIGGFRLAKMEYMPSIAMNYSNNPVNITSNNPVLAHYYANKENKNNHRLQDIEITNMEFETKLKKLQKDVEEFNNRLQKNNLLNNTSNEASYEKIQKEFKEYKSDMNYIIIGLICTQIAFVANMFMF